MSDAPPPMVPPPPVPSEPPPKRKRWPTGSQAIVLIGSGILLGIGGCGAFLATMNGKVVPMIFGAVFFVGVLAFLLGSIEVLILTVRALLGRD